MWRVKNNNGKNNEVDLCSLVLFQIKKNPIPLNGRCYTALRGSPAPVNTESVACSRRSDEQNGRLIGFK